MVSDAPSTKQNIKGFADHRHDQSITLLFVKTFLTCQGAIVPPAFTYQSYISTLSTYRLHDREREISAIKVIFIMLGSLKRSFHSVESHVTATKGQLLFYFYKKGLTAYVQSANEYNSHWHVAK